MPPDTFFPSLVVIDSDGLISIRHEALPIKFLGMFSEVPVKHLESL